MTERCTECGVPWDDGSVPKHLLTCSAHEPVDDVDRVACAMLVEAFEDRPRKTTDRMMSTDGVRLINFTALARVAVREIAG